MNIEQSSIENYNKVNRDAIENELNIETSRLNDLKDNKVYSKQIENYCPTTSFVNANQTNLDNSRQVINDTKMSNLNGFTENSNDQIKLHKIVQTTDYEGNQIEVVNQKNQDTKRIDYLIWDDYFMSVALLSAKRSKDPSTQVGACIINNDNKIVSIGYNGMPMNCNDDLLPWGKNSKNELENKYLYVCHAELNCVLNSNTFSLKDCTLYVTLFPCNECAKVIIQSGIKKIYYLEIKKKEKPEYIASKRLLDMANVKLIHFKPKEKEVLLKLQV